MVVQTQPKPKIRQVQGFGGIFFKGEGGVAQGKEKAKDLLRKREIEI